MNRRSKTLLATPETLLRPQVPPDQEEQQHLMRKQQFTASPILQKDLPKLEIGDVVRMMPIKSPERIWQKATVAKKAKDLVSYVVKTPERGTYRRNSYVLRKSGESSPPKQVEPIAASPLKPRQHQKASRQNLLHNGNHQFPYRPKLAQDPSE